MKKILGILLSLFLTIPALAAESSVCSYSLPPMDLSIASDATATLALETASELLTAPLAEVVLEDGKDPLKAVRVERCQEDGKDLLLISFEETQTTVLVHLYEESGFLVLELVRVEGPWYTLRFFGFQQDKIQTNCSATMITATNGAQPIGYPGFSKRIGAETFPVPFGAHGVKIVLLASKNETMRDTLKTAVSTFLGKDASLPYSTTGGPWAVDSDKSFGNYIITTSALTPESIAPWIEILTRFGVDQVDFHQGGAYRQGDFVFKESVYPKGISDFRKMTDLLHKNGMIAGLHTYSEFIDLKSRYVTPVPHPDLDKMEVFTLAADLDETSDTILVNESTADVSTIVGFFVDNSLYLQIDDELIKFGAPSKEAPYGFTSCERGVCGTRISAHKAGAQVGHLTMIYSLFAPKPGSDLFYELARETARTYNEGGFSMIYLDALDGTSMLVKDRNLDWYYNSLFVSEILRYCNEPPLMEYSTLEPNLWMWRSRAGAMDAFARGIRRGLDHHIESLSVAFNRLLLPGQIGWLKLNTTADDSFPGYQYLPFFTEDINYLGAKMLAHNFGYSYIDVKVDGMKPISFRNGDLMQRYNLLRRNKLVAPSILKKLQDPNLDVVLSAQEDGTEQILPARYTQEDIAGLNGTMTVHNPDAAQKPYIRIENRYAAGNEDDPNSFTLFDLKETGFSTETVEGVKKVNDRRLSMKYDPYVDMSKAPAMGLWVCGDGQGEWVNVQVLSPVELVSGHTDHYIKIDFCGWRFCPMVEAQNGQSLPPKEWPESDCWEFYHEHREPVHPEAISEINIITNKPNTNLKFRTLKALPLRPYNLVNPTLTIGGKSMTFTGEIPSGYFLEYDPSLDLNNASILNPEGELLATAPLSGDLTTLPEGENKIEFSASASENVPVRARVTLRTVGAPLTE